MTEKLTIKQVREVLANEGLELDEEPSPSPNGADEQDDQRPDGDLPFRTLGELIAHAHDASPDRWVIKHYLAPGCKTLISSLPKVGKSTTAFGMVAAIRAGVPFAGLATGSNVGVLYLTEETSVRAVETKAAAVGLDVADPGVLVMRRIDVFGRTWPGIVEALRKRAAAFKNAGGFTDVLIVVDTLGKWAGFEEGQEQDSGATRKAIERLDPLAGDGHAVVILTHSPWDKKRSRGSTAISGEVDVLLHLDGEPGSAGPRSLVYGGGRIDDGETPHSWSLALNDDGSFTSYGEVRPRTAASLARVLEEIRRRGGAVSSVEVAKALGVVQRTARRHLNQLVASGDLERDEVIGGTGGGQSATYRLSERTFSIPERTASGQASVPKPVLPPPAADLRFPKARASGQASGQVLETDSLSSRPEGTEEPGPPVGDGSPIDLATARARLDAAFPGSRWEDGSPFEAEPLPEEDEAKP